MNFKYNQSKRQSKNNYMANKLKQRGGDPIWLPKFTNDLNSFVREMNEHFDGTRWCVTGSAAIVHALNAIAQNDLAATAEAKNLLDKLGKPNDIDILVENKQRLNPNYPTILGYTRKQVDQNTSTTYEREVDGVTESFDLTFVKSLNYILQFDGVPLCKIDRILGEYKDNSRDEDSAKIEALEYIKNYVAEEHMFIVHDDIDVGVAVTRGNNLFSGFGDYDSDEEQTQEPKHGTNLFGEDSEEEPDVVQTEDDPRLPNGKFVDSEDNSNNNNSGEDDNNDSELDPRLARPLEVVQEQPTVPLMQDDKLPNVPSQDGNELDERLDGFNKDKEKEGEEEGEEKEGEEKEDDNQNNDNQNNDNQDSSYTAIPSPKKQKTKPKQENSWFGFNLW